MARPKTDTIVFRQTLSNVSFKKLDKLARQQGASIQDLVREMVREKTQGVTLSNKTNE